eukprot:TRINITY_DN2819_c0_g1_i1.p1 TRINITY_DN2819_c0_g1~~TRINITY_DN2819_c0_g1_i1.p1  ORF type:complete len:1140 (+),score=324.51 TRINITY_DN2819_c0_g1_i1:3-3422(+)
MANAGASAAETAVVPREQRPTPFLQYIVTAQKSTVVTHSATGYFLSATELNLVVSHGSQLVIYRCTPEGLVAALEVPLWGSVFALRVFRTHTDTLDRLVLAVRPTRFAILQFDPLTQEMKTMANGDLTDRGKLSDNFRCLVEPEGRVLCTQIYNSYLRFIPLSADGGLLDSFTLKVEDHITDMVFLHTKSENPVLAVLYTEKSSQNMKTYELNLRNQTLIEGSLRQMNVDMSSKTLIPVPLPFGGCVIVGESVLTYAENTHSHTQTQTRVLGLAKPPGTVTAWAKVDENGGRFLVCEHTGLLSVLVLQHSSSSGAASHTPGAHAHTPAVVDLKYEPLGKTSIASCVEYLDNGVVYIGSQLGNSQLIRLHTTSGALSATRNEYVEILESYLNVGPICDMILLDVERHGQSEVVTCSGGFKEGSLKIIRNGIGINHLAHLELEGVKMMWVLQQPTTTLSDNAGTDSHIVFSFANETKILHFENDQVEEIDITGFSSNCRTLHVQMLGSMCVQATPTSLRLVSLTNEGSLSEWKPQEKITICASFGNNLVCASGSTLYFLQVLQNSIVMKKKAVLANEISCVSLHMTEQGHLIGAVGFWREASFSLISFPTLDIFHTEHISGDFLCRSLLLHKFSEISPLYLLCALGDGTLLSYIVTEEGTLKEKRKATLGTQPLTLSVFQPQQQHTQQKQSHVFSSSDRPTVISLINKKLVYSAVNLPSVTHVSAFNSEYYQDCLAIATGAGVQIGKIQSIQKLHTQSVPLGCMPRRLCHVPSWRMVAVILSHVSVDQHGEENESSSVVLFDDQTFEQQHHLSFLFPNTEQALSLSALQVREADTLTHVLAVGAAHIKDNEPEPTSGRLILFSPNLAPIAERALSGAPYHIASAKENTLILCAGRSVQLLSVEMMANGSAQIEQKNEQTGFVLALTAAVRSNFVLIGDVIKSVTLFSQNETTHTLESLCRDPGQVWLTATQLIDDDAVLVCDMGRNVSVMKRNTDSEKEYEKKRLECAGMMHIGETVNKVCVGSVSSRVSEDSSLHTSLVLATASGKILVSVSVSESDFKILQHIETALLKFVRGVGGFSHADWRKYRTERREVAACGFIDGDLVEIFLELSTEQQLSVLKGLSVSLDEATKLIEDYARVH